MLAPNSAEPRSKPHNSEPKMSDDICTQEGSLTMYGSHSVPAQSEPKMSDDICTQKSSLTSAASDSAETSSKPAHSEPERSDDLCTQKSSLTSSASNSAPTAGITHWDPAPPKPPGEKAPGIVAATNSADARSTPAKPRPEMSIDICTQTSSMTMLAPNSAEPSSKPHNSEPKKSDGICTQEGSLAMYGTHPAKPSPTPAGQATLLKNSAQIASSSSLVKKSWLLLARWVFSSLT